MAGRSRKAFISTLLVGLVATTALAVAQVPLPTPAPQPRTGSVPPPPASVQPTNPTAPTQSGSSWLPSFFGGQKQQQKQAPAAKTNTASFNASQRAHVEKVSAYLSRVHVMTGKFVQIGADGRRATGQFYIQKPGKVQFEYDAPSPIDIVADGSSVVVRDRKLATQDLYPLSQTPLRFLLSDRIDLMRDTNVTVVTADELYVSITVEEKQALIGTSKLMMMFDAQDLQLRQWVVTDPQGYDTTVAVSNLDSSRRPDPKLFRIDYTDYSRER